MNEKGQLPFIRKRGIIIGFYMTQSHSHPSAISMAPPPLLLHHQMSLQVVIILMPDD